MANKAEYSQSDTDSDEPDEGGEHTASSPDELNTTTPAGTVTEVDTVAATSARHTPLEETTTRVAGTHTGVALARATNTHTAAAVRQPAATPPHRYPLRTRVRR